MSEYTGAACPACGSEEIIGDEGPEIDGPHAWQQMSCSACQATWRDCYDLSGFTDLEPGEASKFATAYCPDCGSNNIERIERREFALPLTGMSAETGEEQYDTEYATDADFEARYRCCDCDSEDIDPTTDPNAYETE